MTCKDCIYRCDWATEPYEPCERFKNKELYGGINDNKNTGVDKE